MAAAWQTQFARLGLEDTKELNIILVGKTGAGKSATGNSILGEEVFDDEPGVSVTKLCNGYTAVRFGQKVHVIDTPGLCDTGGIDTTKIIDTYISETKCQLHVICLVLSASNRPTKEEMVAIAMLGTLFGPAMLAYLMVVVTREGELRRKKKMARDFLLSYTGAGAEVLKDCYDESRVVGIDNIDEKMREEQVKALLGKVNTIVSNNRGALYSIKQFLDNKAELKKKQEELERVEKEERERKERKAQAELEEAKRKARQEEQERAALQRERERADFEEEQRRDWEEVARARRQLEEEKRIHNENVKRMEELNQQKGGLWSRIKNLAGCVFEWIAEKLGID